MKKVGYKHAIELLFDEYKTLLEKKSEDKERLQSIREGIDYLCFPFREDITSEERPESPLQDEENPMYIDNLDEFTDEEVEERSERYITNKLFANDILLKLKKMDKENG